MKLEFTKVSMIFENVPKIFKHLQSTTNVLCNFLSRIIRRKTLVNNKKVTAIILAAGNSVRYGKKRNKNFEKT